METIQVSTSTRTYPIHLGHECLSRLPEFLKRTCPEATSWTLVTDDVIKQNWQEKFTSLFARHSVPSQQFILPSGEAAKSKSSLFELLQFLSKQEIDRYGAIIAVGGGAVGDVTGFAASIFKRGVYLLQIPTTLLSMADSCIGGKTGINFNEGKNIIGSFYQPHGTFIDLQFLSSLQETFLKQGFAEIVKHGLIHDPEILEAIDQHDSRELRTPEVLVQLLSRSLQVKQWYVERDEKDLGSRKILNFGHTFAHGIESVSDYEIRHGEAVAIGMIGSLLLSKRMNVLEQEDLPSKARTLLKTLHLPTNAKGLSPDQIYDRLKYDKKRKGDQMSWILLEKTGKPTIKTGISRNKIDAVLRQIT